MGGQREGKSAADMNKTTTVEERLARASYV